MKILLLDNYDSFTYNIVHAVRELGYDEITVRRNDQISLEQVADFDKIILSPGPGIPSEAGILKPLIERYGSQKSILGICLGHQAIGEVYGCQLKNLSSVFHGVSTPIEVIEPDYLFEGLERSFVVGRYHSWAIDPNQVSEAIQVTAVDAEGEIMAIRHRTYDVHGVQFHPESVLTPEGKTIILNFLNHESR